eukprot:snap_masked-scaffold_29-processed-gene-3.8-mRNA-1 protein AED:1.00 eAED:1.00 QI:0/-1/0/0/-1/1/1/0/603
MDWLSSVVNFREFKERDNTRWSATPKCETEIEKEKAISFETQSSASVVSSSEVELRLKYEEDSSFLPNANNFPILFGGGPSSIAPLAESLLLNKEKRFIGNPESSLTLRGRDAQKTVSSLVTVASKYKSFDALLHETGLYYRYLVEVSQTFNIDLADAIEAIYQEEKFAGHKLFYSERFNKFVRGFIVSETRMKVDTLVFEISGSEYRLSKESAENIRSQELPEISVGGVRYMKDDLITMSYRDLSKTHGELHYLSLLFHGWEGVEHFEETSHQNCVKNATDRASFSYSRDVDVLLAEMNVHFCKVAYKMLHLSHNVKKLDPLQESLKTLLQKYLERYDHVPKFLDNDAFIIVGAGRAAGELSRRLTKDVIHSNSLGKIETALQGDSNGYLVQMVLQDMKLKELNELNFKPNRRRIVVVDHRRSRRVEDILTSVSFKDFLTEITKFGIYPHMDSLALDHYKKLYKACIEIPIPQNKAGKKVFLSIRKSLKKLLDSTRENGSQSYKLILVDSYDPKVWGKQEISMMASFITGVETTELSSLSKHLWIVGGAHHIVQGCGGVQASSKYKLKRIHDSHYRKENLNSVSNLGQHLINQVVEKQRNNL